MGDLRNVPLSSIRENPVALRTVNRQSEEYLGLVQSIRQKGFFGAITVRGKTDPETGQEYFELVDGLHRFSASKDAGLTDISVDVTKLNDDAVLEAQLMANIHKVETRPVEYSQQLRRILARNPLMTEAELADRLGKSAAWIGQRLGLTRITNSEIQRLVNEGKIPLSNAYAMAKLPSEDMSQFVDRAMTEGADKFVPAVNKRIKELKENKQQGADSGPPKFEPVAFLRKAKEIKDEMESPAVARGVCVAMSATTAEAGFAAGIKWVLHMDPSSVETQRVSEEEREAARAEEKRKKDVEKTDKKAAELKAKAEEAAKAAAAAKAVSAAH